MRKVVTKATARQTAEALVPQKQATLKSDKPKSTRSQVYSRDARSHPASRMARLGANISVRVNQPPKNVFLQTAKLRQELREQREADASLGAGNATRSPSGNLQSPSSPSPSLKRRDINSINRDLLVMAAAIDQTITNRTRETLSTPDGQHERMPSRLQTPTSPARPGKFLIDPSPTRRVKGRSPI